MATQFDEAVGNLQRFCGLLTQANDGLKEHTSALEEQAGAVDDLADGVEEAFGDLTEGLDDLLERLNEDGGEAEEAVEGVAEAAGAVAEARLGGAEQELEEAESAFQQRLDADRSSLDGDFEELTAGGFEALAIAVEAVEGGVQGSGQEAEEAFDALESGLQGFEQEVESFRTETEAALSEAADGLTGEVTEGLTSDGAECASAWEGELPSELESGCSAVEGPVTGAYGAFGDAGVGAGDDLIETVAAACAQAADFILDEEGTQVEQAGEAVVDHGFADLQGELGQVQVMVEAGAETSAALEPMVGELETAKSVVAEVDQLLAALGG